MRTTPSNTDAHEAQCRRCGISCHFAVPINGLAVVIDELRCRFLAREPDGRFRCTVYSERLERAPWCRTVDEALAGGYLARDCPYARGQAGYRGKTRLAPSLLATVLPAIRAELAKCGAPLGIDETLVVRLLEQDGSRWRAELDTGGVRYRFERIG